MKRAAFRVDASARIGTGHLRRCISLAQAMQDAGWHTQFVCRELGHPSPEVLAAFDLPATTLPAPQAGWQPAGGDPPHAGWAEVPWSIDVEQTAAVLDGRRPELIVIDHYGFDSRWHDALRARLGCRIAVIDDTADRALAPDVLIDHNHAADHRRKYMGHLPAGVPGLFGPAYALLARDYARAPRCEVHPQVQSVGIFMGGIDHGNHTATALDALSEAGFAGDVEVVTTSQNPHLRDLRRRCARPGARLTLTLDVPNLSGFFARHGLQIGASGGATWERCCIGAPSVCVIAADNQRQVLMPLRELDVLTMVDETPPTVATLAGVLRTVLGDASLRERLARRARALVDGCGAARVAQHLTALCTQ